MKRTIIILIISIVSACIIRAQTWAPAEAVWRYNYVNLGGRGYVKITVEKDTVVDGITCKKLIKRAYLINQFTGNPQNYGIGSEFMYETNGVVFIRYRGVFDTLYNMNALPGESWNVADSSPVTGVCDIITKVVVIDTGHVTINGANLKRLIVDYHYKSSGSFLWRDTIVERIGTLAQYLLPWDLCLLAVDAHEGGELRCYADSVTGEYKHNFISDCTVIISVEESAFSRSVKVFPVPASDILQVQFNDLPADEYIIKVMDCMGETVLMQTVKETDVLINTMNISQGVYLLYISNGNDDMMVRRFLKQ